MDSHLLILETRVWFQIMRKSLLYSTTPNNKIKNPVHLRLWLFGDKTQIRIQNRHSRTVRSSSLAREEPLTPLRLLDCWRTDSLGLGCIGGTHSLPPLCPIAGTIVASNNSALPRAFLLRDLARPSCCWKCHRTSPKLMPSR